MEKIYCVYCGEENNIGNKKCCKCKKELNPKQHLWKDYIYNHIKGKIKGEITESTISLITNYVKTHLYGVIMFVSVIVTVTTGIVSLVNNNSYITEVEEKPKVSNILEELSLDNEIVNNIYKYLKLNADRVLKNSFYETKKINYNKLSEEEKVIMSYIYDSPLKEKIVFNSCDEAKKYSDIYSTCLKDAGWVVGEYASVYYKMDFDKLNKNYQKLFGSDKTFDKINFKVYESIQCNYYEDEYMCYTLPAGWMSGVYEKTKLVKAYKVNNTIELYDKYIFLVNFDDSNNSYGTYTDNKMQNKISAEYSENLVDQGILYKHIFRKDKSGNYYWYSSEPTDKIPTYK